MPKIISQFSFILTLTLLHLSFVSFSLKSMDDVCDYHRLNSYAASMRCGQGWCLIDQKNMKRGIPSIQKYRDPLTSENETSPFYQSHGQPQLNNYGGVGNASFQHTTGSVWKEEMRMNIFDDDAKGPGGRLYNPQNSNQPQPTKTPTVHPDGSIYIRHEW